MKRLILPLLIASIHTAAADVEVPVGSVTNNLSFAVRNGTTFTNSTFESYEGKILVVMMMTPWCPTCQSNASAVGDGIIDYFNASSRGALRGKNANGIEVRSLLLSTEEASQWDSVNSSFATSNAYQQWGLDATPQRTNPRQLLGYFRGGFIAATDLHAWGDDRRRVVVINLVRNSASHAFRQVVINQNYFTSSNAASAQALINSIAPAPPISTFSQWAGGYTFPAGSADADADADPDKDGVRNLLEFFHGTHPLQAGSKSSGPAISRTGNTVKMVYRRAKNIGGYTLGYRYSNDLKTWKPLSSSGLNTTTNDLGTVEEITVDLPAPTDPTGYYQLLISTP